MKEKNYGRNGRQRQVARTEEEPEADDDMAVSKKSVSWTSRFVMKALQRTSKHLHPSGVTFLVQTFWTHPHAFSSD